MSKSHQKALRKHRQRQQAKGLVRVEVQAPASDAGLLREVAATLRSGSRRAAEVRSLLRASLRPPRSVREALTMELPDDVLDSALARPRDSGREVDV